jgi:hypothetical protein
VAWSWSGRVDAALARTGRRGDTLLVVTSDHGEGLDEHGEAVHGFFVYETTLRVPLLFRGPGVVPGTRVQATARSIDLFPTVLDVLGVAAPAGARLAGRSLAAVLRGGPQLPETATYAESLTPRLHYGWSDLRALREGRWKYILAPRPELYDLQGPADAELAAGPRRRCAARPAHGLVARSGPRRRPTRPAPYPVWWGSRGPCSVEELRPRFGPPTPSKRRTTRVNRLMRGLTPSAKDWGTASANLRIASQLRGDSTAACGALARAPLRPPRHLAGRARRRGLADCRAVAGDGRGLAVLKDGQEKNPATPAPWKRKPVVAPAGAAEAVAARRARPAGAARRAEGGSERCTATPGRARRA